MNEGLVSLRYATALYEFAQNSQSEDSVYEEVKKLLVAYTQFPELRQSICHPALTVETKKELLQSITGGQKTSILSKFFDLVFHNRREYKLNIFALKYLEVYRERKNILAGELTLASDMSSDIESRLVEIVEKQVKGKLELKKSIDPEIIGGFILQAGDYRWDASIAGQLRRIRKSLIDEN
jgi:F-type H+-transporting ATPase subunit delta